MAAIEDTPRDGIATAMSRALAVANATAEEKGVDLARSIITIAEESPPPDRLWRVHYGPREYLNRRGGDLIVVVDERTAAVQRVIRGQ